MDTGQAQCGCRDQGSRARAAHPSPAAPLAPAGGAQWPQRSTGCAQHTRPAQTSALLLPVQGPTRLAGTPLHPHPCCTCAAPPQGPPRLAPCPLAAGVPCPCTAAPAHPRCASCPRRCALQVLTAVEDFGAVSSSLAEQGIKTLPEASGLVYVPLVQQVGGREGPRGAPAEHGSTGSKGCLPMGRGEPLRSRQLPHNHARSGSTRCLPGCTGLSLPPALPVHCCTVCAW